MSELKTLKVNRDTLTTWICRVLEMFLLNNPKATGLGIIVGSALEGSKEAWSKFIGIPNDIILSIKWYVFICVPVALANVPFMFRKHKIDPAFETQLYQFDKVLKQSNLSETQKRLMYIEFVTNMVDSITSSADKGQTI